MYALYRHNLIEICHDAFSILRKLQMVHGYGGIQDNCVTDKLTRLYNFQSNSNLFMKMVIGIRLNSSVMLSVKKNFLLATDKFQTDVAYIQYKL